jgi:putative oxidoreductase
MNLWNTLLGNAALVNVMLLVGRIFSSVVFLVYGVSKVLHTPRIQEYMRVHNDAVPVGLVYVAIAVQIGCGALVMLGYQTRFGAFMLAGFCVVATVLFHSNFDMQGEMTHFLKDFAIAGGFLFMLVHGPGALSIDAYLERSRKP